MLKKLFVASAILSSSFSLANEDNGLSKVVAVQAASIQMQKAQIQNLVDKIDQLKNERFALGSIQQSLLSESDFKEQAGEGWVKMEGQDISDSQLCEKTGFCRCQCPRKILRTAGGLAAGVGGVQVFPPRQQV